MLKPSIPFHLAAMVAVLTMAGFAAADDTDELLGYFPLDKSAGEASGARIYGQLIGAGGVAVEGTPEYVDGKFGSAIRFDGNAALRVPLDLDASGHPRLSLTAWVFLEDVGEGCDVIASTGDGHGPALVRCGRALELRAGGEVLRAENALSPSRWHFVAGVWNYDTGTARLHWRARSADGEFDSDDLTPSEPDLWLGAHNDTLADAAKRIRLDEVRIYSEALDEGDIQEIRDSAPLLGRLRPADDAEPAAPGFAKVPRIPSRDIVGRNRFPAANSGGSAEERDEATDPDEATADTGSDEFRPVTVTPILEAKPLEIKRLIGDGERQLSDLTGKRGNIIKEVDFRDRPLNSFLWSEIGDKPCEFAVSSSDPQGGIRLRAINLCGGGSAQFACESVPCTGAVAAGYEREFAVRLAPGQAITAVRVCLNGRGDRVKGIEIRGAGILGTGALTGDTVTDSERLTNCRDKNWDSLVLCPGRHVATGVRAHFKEGKGLSAKTDALTGLELVCRPTQQPAE